MKKKSKSSSSKVLPCSKSFLSTIKKLYTECNKQDTQTILLSLSYTITPDFNKNKCSSYVKGLSIVDYNLLLKQSITNDIIDITDAVNSLIFVKYLLSETLNPVELFIKTIE